MATTIESQETKQIKRITDLPNVNQAERECYRAGHAAAQAEIAKLKRAASEARAALYGCREIVGSIANVQYAIDLLDDALAAE